MQSWMVMTFTIVQPADPFMVILIITLVCSVVGVQADDTALGFDHHPCLPRHVLPQVGGAVGQAVLQILPRLATPSTATWQPSSTLAAWAISSAEMIRLNILT